MDLTPSNPIINNISTSYLQCNILFHILFGNIDVTIENTT